VLRDGGSHGYDLAEALAAVMPDDPVDLGNLYRLLRALEEEGLVRSAWRHDLPGRSKRTYELTPAGLAVLDAWGGSLRSVQATIDAFLARLDTPSAATSGSDDADDTDERTNP
jgi:DNA-binding PadR family transcriptional regulator